MQNDYNQIPQNQPTMNNQMNPQMMNNNMTPEPQKKSSDFKIIIIVVSVIALIVIGFFVFAFVIASKNVTSMFDQAKQNSFASQVKDTIRAAETQWITKSTELGTVEMEFSKNCTNSLTLIAPDNYNYYIKVDENGQVVKIMATDGTYAYQSEGAVITVLDVNTKDVLPAKDYNVVIPACN